MRIVNEKLISRFARRHADASGWLETWLSVARAAEWRSIQDVRIAFPSVDGGVKVKSGGTVTVFDVRGNKYRMVVSLVYAAQTMTILELMTHAEYSRDSWKEKY